MANLTTVLSSTEATTPIDSNNNENMPAALPLVGERASVTVIDVNNTNTNTSSALWAALSPDQQQARFTVLKATS